MATATEDLHTLYSQTFLDNYLVKPNAFDMGCEVLTTQGCIQKHASPLPTLPSSYSQQPRRHIYLAVQHTVQGKLLAPLLYTCRCCYYLCTKAVVGIQRQEYIGQCQALATYNVILCLATHPNKLSAVMMCCCNSHYTNCMLLNASQQLQWCLLCSSTGLHDISMPQKALMTCSNPASEHLKRHA